MTRGGGAARGALVAVGLIAAASAARADDGFIGRRQVALEVDDCAPHPDLPKAELEARFTEHYDRAEVLYLQGDYPGAITEFVGAHCLIAIPSVLKDIAQAYERSVRYEMAIAYLERFVLDTPDAVARQNAVSRVQVLSRLASTLRVATDPPNAKVTVRNAQQVVAQAVANTDDLIELPTGTYTMTVELPDYEPVTEELTLGIGQPYSYSFRLAPRLGRLRISAVPGDARILVDDRVVGVGSYDGEVPLGSHAIAVEQSGWQPAHREVEVKDVGIAETSIALQRPPASDRWLAVAGAATYGLYVGGSIATITEPTGEIAATATLGGVVIGGIGGYLLIPPDIHHGTTSILMTAITAGGIAGGEIGLAFSEDTQVVASTALAGSVVGATTAVLASRAGEVSEGQAAIVNSGVLWGTISGLLFTQLFASGGRTDLAITSAGSTLGLISGVVLAKRTEISRRRAIYIDLAGAAGLIAGLAVQNGVQSSGQTASSNESRSHFTLAGMAIGLGLGVYLTRNTDAPVLRVQPQVTPVRGPTGATTGAIVGVGGAL